MVTWNSKFGFCFLAVLAVSCGQNSDTHLSSISVTNGEEISEDVFPAVVRLDVGGTCTGTFLSDTALLTAAHCVKHYTNKKLTRYRVYKPKLKYTEEEADQVILHPKYRRKYDGNGIYTKKYEYDLAIAIYPSGTSKYWREISDVIPNAGDDITIVGYGNDHFIYENGRYKGRGVGTKRVGYNQLDEVGDRLLFSGKAQPEGEISVDSASAGGDSGGPMFIDGKIVGVTSTGNVEEWVKYSQYTRLSLDANIEFLQSAVEAGADIPGF